MNEDLLLAIFEKEGFKAKGLNFDEFKVDMQNEALQQEVFKRSGFESRGVKFDEFKTDLGFAKSKPNPSASVRFAPMQEALLDAIGDVESPDYNVITGGGRFDDYTQHPNIVGVVTEYGPSTAAGKYQFTKSTWDDISKKLDLKDFSPDSQRVAALYLAESEYKNRTGRSIYTDISAGKLENVRDVLGGTGAATVWQGLQGDAEFANRFKSHLSRYEALKEPPKPKTIQEAAAELESAMKDNTKVANDLQYNLNDTSVVETKNLPKDLASIKKELDDTRLNLKNTDHDIIQKYHTRQEELRQNFEQTPVFQSINEKYSTQYNDEVGKFVESNIKTNPEYVGLQQKIQDDLNSGVITSEEANQKINDYVSQIVDNEPTLKDFKTNIDKNFSDEYNQVFQGYVSKDDILSSLLTQRESVFSTSQAFQKQLMDAYNSKVNEYNKEVKTSAANQPKSSKEVGLPGGGPLASGFQNKDYTGGLLKMNKTSRDYDKELKALPETTGFNKDAALAAWYTDQKRAVPTQKSKDLTKKATDYFEKGNQIKLKRYEALKEELFTMSPLEFGRQTVEDYTLKVQEYGDTERGYYEQDKAAIQGYIDEGLLKFKEDAGLKLSYKFGDKYDEFVKEEEAIGILIKSGKDVKDRIQAFQKEYSDILEDDDYLLANREIPKLYKAAKFEESQLADTYKQAERLSRVDEEQAYANANPVIASINSIIGKAVGATVQSVGSILEQGEKIPRVPGFAQLMGYVSEAGENLRMIGGEIIAKSPTSTMMQGQFSETYATTPTGKRVVYNDKGDVQYIRNEDGTLYEGFEADVIIDSAKDIKKEEGYNPFSLVGQFIDVAAYMVPTIAMSAATSGAGAAAGMGATGVNAMSKLGMFMGGYAQGYSSAKEEALKQRGLGNDEAEAFAVMSGLGSGVIENFNPIEGKIFTKSLSKNVIKENVVNLAAGKYTPYNVFENIAVNALKGGFKESVLEEVPQAFFETGLKNYYNQKKGSEFQSEISSDQWIDILITSFGMGAVADGVRSGKGSDLGKAALKTIVTNRDLYESYLTGMEKTSPEMAAKLRGEIDPLLREIDAIDGLTPGRKEKSVELLYDIRTVESKLASIVEPTLRKPYEEKLVELRKQLGKTVQVPTDAEGEPLEGEELQAVKQAAAQKKKDKEDKPEEPPTPPAPSAAAVAETTTTIPIELSSMEGVELKNEGKAEAPTKENVTERLSINNPFYKKVEDALVKLGLIEKYNPETGKGDVVGGYALATSDGGISAGKMMFNKDGSISYFDGGVKVSFDKNGNVISENTKEVAAKNKENEIEGKKEAIANLEKTRDSENFKYKEVTETDPLGRRKKVRRLKTAQELKESTDKINAAIDKAKSELAALEAESTTQSKVEATAKALEGVDTQPLKKQLGIEANWDMIGEGDALSGKDPVLAYTQKQLPDWNRESQKGNINPNSKITYDIVRGKYGGIDQKDIVEAKDENGLTIGIIKLDDNGGIEHIAVAPEFRGKGVANKLIQTLKENNPQLNLSKTKLRSKGFEKAFSNKIISEAYHAAKADGSNPELVKAVEELLGKKPTYEQKVEATAKALEGVDKKSNKSLWDKIKDLVNKISQKLGGISDNQHINDFKKAKAEWSKLSRKEKQLKRADYELDGLSPSEGGYYKVGDVLFDLDLSENIFSLLISGKKLLSILPKLGVTTFNAENRPAEEMFAHYSDGKIHLNNNSAYENIRQLTRAITHELGHHEFTKLSEKEKDYVNSLSIETGMALQYKAQGDGKQTLASLEEENFADYVMQYFQGKLYGDETLLNKIPERLRKMFDDKYANLLNENNDISQAYHKAKADGSNPELVKAVEDLLGIQPAAQTNTQETPQQDKATEKEVETLLEPIGKTTKEREDQIFKFFALAAAGGDKTKAREIARVTNNLWENVAKQLGKRSKQAAEAWIQAKVALIGKTSVAGATGLGNAKFQEAQTYFTRNADRLPLTLAIFNRPEFIKLQGKEINPITVLNSLNQTGIKQVEKDLIKNIIDTNFGGRKTISYDELEATVRANIMPLERIFTSSYANYGMNNLGNGNYGEANTIILNAPIEHGVTGHFSGDFTARGRKNIKYVPKQLNDNTWVAVEEGYEANANENNIYQFVGTAGTKEAVENWIDEHENVYTTNNTKVEAEKNFEGLLTYKLKNSKGEIIEYVNEEDLVGSPTKEFIHNLLVNKHLAFADYDLDINKGMFGHIRVWQDGEVFTVAELQSDYFQNNNARKNLLENTLQYKEANRDYLTKMMLVQDEKRPEILKRLRAAGYAFVTNRDGDNTTKVYIPKNKFGQNLGGTKGVTIEQDGDGRYQILYKGKNIDSTLFLSEDAAKRYVEKISNEDAIIISAVPSLSVTDIPANLQKDFLYITEGYSKEIQNIEKEFQKKKEEIVSNLPQAQKQFIASQKSWEQRMVREAIKEASLSGATKLRFPTPYTLSVIEGYVSTKQYGQEGVANYTDYSGIIDDPQIGDSLTFLGAKHHVVNIFPDGTVNVSPDFTEISKEFGKRILVQDYRKVEINNQLYQNGRTDTLTEYLKENNFSKASVDYTIDRLKTSILFSVANVNIDLKTKIIKLLENFHSLEVSKKEEAQLERDMRHIAEDGTWRLQTGGLIAVKPDGDMLVSDDNVGIENISLKTQGVQSSEFSIGDLTSSQQTVAYKYEEIANILKQERGEDKVEVVTDENGFDWYETQITPEDLNKPVVAFQADNANLSVQEAIDKINNNLLPEIDRLIKEMSNKDNIKKRGWTTAQAAEHVRELRAVKAQVEKNMKDPKFQENGVFRGATIELANNQFIIAALDTPNESTFIHEMAHSFESDLLPEEKQTFIDEYNELFGEKEKGWSTDVSEYFARTWEKYLSNGRKLTSAEVKDKGRRETLQEVFDKFTDWLQGIYNGVIEYNNSKGVKKEITLSPAAQAIFDNINNIKTQTKDENKNSQKGNGKDTENEVRGQGQEGNVTTNQQPTKNESKSKSNKDEQGAKGQEGQREGQVGSTLAEEQGEREGEEVGDVVEGAVKLSPKYQRYVSRALATPSIPQEFKDALLKNAPLKVPVTYAQVEAFAKAVVDQLETLDDYVKAAGELVQQFAETITKVDTDPTVLNRGSWEITALKMIEKRVADNYGPTEAAKLHQRLANVGSVLGQSLRQYGINDPSVMYVQTFGRHSVTESPVYDADTFEGSDVTHRDVANSLLDLYESAIQEEKEKLKAKIAAEIKVQLQKDKAKDTSSKTDVDPNTDAKKAKADLVKRLSDKADFYLNRFNSRLGEFSSGFDIEAIIDYTLYAYYKTAGSVVKTKRLLEKRFGKDTVDTNWDTISNSENFNKATLDIAQEKLLAAIGNAGRVNEFTGTETSNRTPAQMIIQSITRQLQKKDKGPVSKKTIEEVITQKSMDIDTVSNLRRDINGGLLNVEEDKRAEILAQVDDLLAVLVKGKLDTIATPWVKKTLIRQKIKESADNLGVTVDQLIDDITNRQTITNSTSEEFLSRTGMSVEDAAPYIKIIEDSIESEINQKVKAKAEKLIGDSYGKNIIKLDEVVKTLEKAYKFEQDNLAAKKAELTDAVRNKTKSIEELREMQKGVKELQAKAAESKKKLQTYKVRLASGQKELKRKVSSKTFQRMPTVERVGFLVRNGGLSDETVFQAFAEVIGARNFTQKDAETLRSLYERLDTSLFQIDKKEAAEAIAKFAFEIKSDVDKQIFVDILDSYAYSNMLGSLKTADVAVSSGYGTFLYQEILSAAAQITKDVYALVTGKNSEFMNMKLMLDSFTNMSNTRFSRAQFVNVLVGKDGISLPEINMQGEKSKQSGSRLEANMAYLDKVRALRDRARKNGENAKAFGYNALIAHSIVSRMLIVADYVTTSTLLPYKVHRNLTDTSIKELTVEGLIHPSYNQVRERVKSKMKLDEVEAQLQNEGLTPKVMIKGELKRSNAYNKRKAQILYEFIEESDKVSLVQAEDSMRRIAFTGRISGMSGAAVEYLNRAFNTLSLIGDNKETGKKNVGSMLVASLVKLATTPFAGATFRVIQFVKNSTPFGVLQIKDKASRKNAFDVVKLFDEYNYYNVYNGSVERVPATQFEKEVRWLMAMTPSIAAIAMFSTMFDYDDEEDRVSLAEDTNWIFTSAYSPAMARKLGLTESTYEPYTAYKRNEDGTFDRQFAYKDVPYFWFLASVGRLQEKLIFDQEESLPTGQTPETKVKDPLSSVDAYLAAIRSALAFSTQGSISSAGGAITAGTELIEGGVPDPFQLKKTGQGLLRQFIPFSALQAEADNYDSLLTQAARRKGVTAVGDVVDKMIMSKPFMDNYEFDVLGENVVQRPYGPVVTTITTMAAEGLGHAMKGDVELKYPNARKVLTRFMDIDKIKKLYFSNIGPESYKATTVWAPEDPQIHHDLSRDAADLKGQAIEEDYENLMSLPKMDFEKKLKKINDDANESIKIRYAISKLSSMYDEEMLAEKIKSTKELNEFMVEQSIYIDPEGNIKDFDYLANYEK